MTECKETGRDASRICAHLTFEAIAIDANVKRALVFRRHVERTVREFKVPPVAPGIVVGDPAHERKDGVLDREHVPAKVPREYLEALGVGNFARFDVL